MAIIENDYRITVKQVDFSGNLSNRGLIMIFEDIACYHSDLIGCGFNDRPKTHFAWILLNWKIEILKRARYGDIVKVKTWTHSSNKLFSYRDFEMYDKDNNLLAIASSKWVLMDSRDYNIIQISDALAQSFSPEDKSVFGDCNYLKLIEPSNMVLTYSFEVKRRDIDVNRHMNNLYYLDYAFESLPDEVYSKIQEYTKIEILYKLSAKLNDIFPEFIREALIEGIDYFSKKIKGFNNDDVVLSAVESRTSCPIRIIRDENFESSIMGIFPIGEGAGYAGGITTCAIDGMKMAKKILEKYKAKEK